MSTDRDERLAARSAGGPVPGVPLLNIANILTIARIVVVPIFLAALFVGDGHDPGWRIVAGALFALAAVTDRVDGQLARRYGLVTDFGKLADPIADKALIGAALIGLSVLGDLSWWVTVVIVIREVGVTLLRFAVLRHGVIPAGRGGKLKTLVQTVAVGLYVLPLSGVSHQFAAAAMGVAVGLTVVTGLDYVVQAARLRMAPLPVAPQSR
ncbi:CDP-diacylglycerol--glycerol-3-phosphate 3-phosphatidyltransferase [Skermania piniformis]|uniref:CDP-diacylglycerol--glycerol-3-phosphate 3-phosphatidyltransferase n=1 Tax=Skermania pinensis TaxID=39122 RepID=A0ABX8S7W7_9ACTN|nr:CDP-diacylglycerol--glycerol-3-phosphate 3-phosphatidyltransferase [Skermania piniformis]QXQ12600.1 CDP-diacylglycerol--glycerol-3-phosphate 3-phosphatidyltransferase [Skermania piniformis]